MKRKLVLVALVLCLALLAMVPVATRAMGSCSGDDCGCYVPDEQDCLAGCPPVGDPNHQTCVAACRHAAICCALECCGGYCR